MKKLIILSVLLLIIIKSYGQPIDSLTEVNKNYMNTIQTSLLGFGGYFGLQYERAINKDWSFGMQGNVTYPLKYVFNAPSGVSIYTKYSLNAFARYYLDKNSVLNNGLYIQAEFGYFHQIQYIADHKQEANSQKKYPWIGAGIGYQIIVKKRLVLAAGISIRCGAKGQMYNHFQGWQKMYHREGSTPLTLNIGYAF